MRPTHLRRKTAIWHNCFYSKRRLDGALAHQASAPVLSPSLAILRTRRHLKAIWSEAISFSLAMTTVIRAWLAESGGKCPGSASTNS
jgi:hypothetical protein